MKTKMNSSINVEKDTNYLVSCPKSEKPLICKHCGGVYYELNVYNGFCSWTCKSKHLKEQARKKEEKDKLREEKAKLKKGINYGKSKQ